MSTKNCIEDNFLLCHDPGMTFAKRIKELRIKRGLTQQDVADVLGVKYQAVQKYEKGTAKPQADRLPDLASLLGVDLDYLFEEDQSDFGREVLSLPEHSEARASRIYVLAAQEFGFDGIHWFHEKAIKKTSPPGVEDYLNAQINDAELYRIAKAEMQRHYLSAIRHFERGKGRRRGKQEE